MSSTGALSVVRLEHHGAYAYPIIETLQSARSGNVKLQKSGPDREQLTSQAQLGNVVKSGGASASTNTALFCTTERGFPSGSDSPN